MDALVSAENPAQAFLRRDDATSKKCRAELARIYNVQATLQKNDSVPLGPLDELHVSDLFSFDQVWHQLETRNSTLIPYASRRIDALINAASEDSTAGNAASAADLDDLVDGPSSDEDHQEAELEPEQNGLLNSDEEGDDEDGDGDGDGDLVEDEGGDDKDVEGDDDDDDEDGENEPSHPSAIRKSSKPANPKRRVRFDLDTSEDPAAAPNKPVQAPKSSSRSGSLEDGFFSIADMEAFADDAEMLAQQGKLIASDDESDDAIPDRSRSRRAARLGIDEDSVDEDEDDDDVAENDIDNDAADTKDRHKFLYGDFFDPPGASEAADAVRAARTRALLLDDIDDGDMGDEDEDDGDGATADDADEAADNGVPTSLQKSRARTRKTIEAIEEANITKRPWMLRGEVSASARPKDSLLQTDLQHDIAVPPKIFVNSDANEVLEDVIKQRIVDGLFDDVVLALPEEYAAKKRGAKKELPDISQEKPKEGLGELYEREFAEDEDRRSKEMAASNTVQKEDDKPETEEQKEVNQMWGKLSKKLDSLSSLHFQPTPQEEVEMTVNENVKALSKEEAIPDVVSDGNLLAPKEVFTADKKDAKGEREVTKEERRAKRRRNKGRGKKSKVASQAVDNAKKQADPVLADKRRAENALARRGKKLKTTDDGMSSTKKGVDASFARAAYKAREFVSKPGELEKKPMSASQLRL